MFSYGGRGAGTIRLLTSLLFVSMLTACTASAPLQLELSSNRTTLTPNERGDRLDLTYRVSRPALVSVSVLAPSGEQLPLRVDEPRRPDETYVYPFDGTAPMPNDSAQRRVLESGQYEILMQAVDGTGQRDEQRQTIAIQDADTHPPAIENLAVYPPAISPNFDGIDDVATITFRLTKRARVQRLALTQAGNRVYVGGTELLEPGEYAERWDGTAKEKPVEDGHYRYLVRAVDTAGNVVQTEIPITVQASGQPEGRILRVDFTPRKLMVGQIVTVRAQIRNTGTLPLRTAGPEPSFLYSSFDSFGSIANHQFIDRLGTWRLGVDWAGSPSSTGSKYPYRWGLGRDLQPGEEVTVEGQLRVEHGPALDRQVGPLNNRIFVYAGLIHEGIAFHDDRVGGTWIEIGY